MVDTIVTLGKKCNFTYYIVTYMNELKEKHDGK